MTMGKKKLNLFRFYDEEQLVKSKMYKQKSTLNMTVVVVDGCKASRDQKNLISKTLEGKPSGDEIARCWPFRMRISWEGDWHFET